MSETHFGYEKVDEEVKADRVRGVFDSVAPKYDLMNDLMSLGLHRAWKAYAVAVANVRLGDQVLDLAGGTGREVIRLGQAGYIVKGIAFVIVGGLFGWAAITYDAEKAGGLDDALRTVNEAPAGSVLLTVMALGLIAFGVYCFFWARHPKISTSGGDTGERSG